MWVMTIDQQGSRVVGDRVDGFLGELSGIVAGSEHTTALVRGFERTVGDEVQAVVEDPRLVVDVALRVLRLGGWSVGIGAGDVDRPLPTAARAGSGAAFVHARDAVEAAKSRSRSVPLAVRGDDPAAAGEAEGVLMLLGAVAARRSVAGWAVVDRMSGPARPRQEDLAAALGIIQ